MSDSFGDIGVGEKRDRTPWTLDLRFGDRGDLGSMRETALKFGVVLAYGLAMRGVLTASGLTLGFRD